MEYGLVIVWLATFLLLGLAALPVASALFPRFADRGAAFAIPVALAALGLVGFLVGHVAFGWPALLAGVAVIVGAGYLAGGRFDVDERAYAEAAAVFAGAFLFLVAVRMVDPSVFPSGGEKFLDFGLLQSSIRADRLPPEDVWFAGEPVSYYYGGHALAALLAELTFTPARYAYNLALAGFYAAMVVAAWGLAGNVVAAQGGPRRLGAALGAFFVGLASNLHTPGAVLLWVLPDGMAKSVGPALGLGETAITWTPTDFFYWRASRVLTGSINEFPLFAWMNGDLHAHMMSTPFLLLAAALAFAYWRTPEDDVRRRRLYVFGAIPAVGGLLAVVNTWSFPSVFGLAFLALAFAEADPATLLPSPVAEAVPDPDSATLAGELRRVGAALLVVGGALAVGLAWSLPFWVLGVGDRTIAVVPTDARLPLGELLVVHGAFLAAFVPYLARRVGAGIRPWFDRAVVGLGVLVVFVGALALHAAAVGLFVPIGVAAWVALRYHSLGRDAVGDVGFETVLLLGGVGLVLVAEFLYVESVLGRFNTTFKIYTQVWQLFAVAVAVVLTRMTHAGVTTLGSPDTRQWRRATGALAVALVFLTSLYAGFAVPSHFGGGGPVASIDDPTLDATEWVEIYHPEEAPAIAWLNAREGQPNMASAPACGCNSLKRYSWANAPASLTGVPTLAGWGGPGGHEYIYRTPEQFQQRVQEVRLIFQGPPDRQRQLLREHNVEYVYVGPNERELYGDITVQELDAVQPVRSFGDGTVVIYEVDQSKL